MADDLDKFIEEQKAKLAQDKAELENDPPYMEVRIKEPEKLSDISKTLISVPKENIPPNSQQNYPLGNYGLSLPLGEEYERKKHKLKEELQQDYKRYLSQKNYLTAGEVDPYTQGLSLPIDERKSAKEKLRIERNKEYNQYLRDKEELNERLTKLGKRSTENEVDRNKKPIAVTRLQPELHTEVQPGTTGAEPPRKDAFTSTERYEELLNKRWLEEDRYHRLEDDVELRSRLLSKRLDEDLDVPCGRHCGFASQSVIPVRKHHRFDEGHDFGRRNYRIDHDPEMSEEMGPRFRCESAYDRKSPRVIYAERPYLDGTVRDIPVDYEDETKERARAQQISRTGNSRSQVQASSSAHEQPKSAAEMQYATGLALGGQNRELLQRKKEKYKQELIEQMTEQQRNKRREKELELLVAASGAQDPEKKPDRLTWFGLTRRASEEKVPPERSRVAFQTPVPVPSSSPVNEDFHRGLASTLGEIAAPRLAPIPPPPPPVLTDNYRTPYDDAYYFYGARNPLDPNLAYYGTGMGMQPTPNLDPPLGQTPVEQSVINIGQRNTGGRQRSIGVFSEEKTKPSKEATLSYQQELQQQIKEREERRRREREERERYEAELEAEMRNYNPWGRGGGGAPLRDAKGNLITDLNTMHKQNKEAFRNPESRLCEDRKAVVSVNLSLASPRPENTEASTKKIAGFPFAQTSPFARGNVFGEPPSPQHLKRQESYKNFLRLQIEEKRRREEAEREKLRMEEEKEEKRIAEQRMRIQKAYEDEQEEERKKVEKRRLKNKEIIPLVEERKKEAEERRKEKEERQDEQLGQYFEKEKTEEEKKMFSRQPSPIVPALQKKSIRKEERIPSAESRLSYCTEIKEREERRRREREERERYEAELEAEMRNYNPWGRGGGGAPLRDAKGNLITDLNTMHKQNKEAFRNPESRLCEDRKAVVSVNLSLASPRPENTEASTKKIAGFPFAQTSPFARGNVFGEPPSPQHLKRQESYKNFLRLQIEEKRRREEAEREKLRMEEEKEEKRIAEQRMRIQKAYEDEQEEERKKVEKRRLKNKEIIPLVEERKKEAEERRKEKEERQDEQLGQYFEKEKTEEEKKMFSRQPSPIVPALQKKSIRKEERIPSAESRLSYCTEDPPQPRVPSPPVPARRNQLRAFEDRKNVINELSEIRKHLRSKERRLQEQLLNMASDDDVPITRGRREKNPKDIFEMARLRLQAPVRRLSSKEAQDPVNIQNIWEFNELKYKDSETRMGLRHMYPDPPKDDQTLEIQQQALLREQQKKLDRMRMRRGTDDDSTSDNNPQTMRLVRNESNEFLKNSLLESDSTFIGANGEMFPALEEVNSPRQLPLSARERRRIKQKALERGEDVPLSQTPLPQPDSFSLHSNFSLNVDQLKGKNEERLRRLTELQHKSAYLGDNISLGEADDLLKHVPSNAGRRPSSVDTVATEPWLRPGTSETLQKFMDEQSSPAKLSPENLLPLGWQGLSTAHG